MREVMKWDYKTKDGHVVGHVNGHLNIVRYLVEQGADIHADNGKALWSAAGDGHLNIVRYLVEQGADTHADNDLALRFAARNGDLDIVRYLVGQGADIHAGNDLALRLAAAKGQLDFVHYLVTEKDADLDVLDQQQRTGYERYLLWRKIHNDFSEPAVLGAFNPYLFKPAIYDEVVKMLAAEGYDNDAGKKYAYHISALFGSEERVLQYLKKWGKAGEQPLHDIAHMIHVPAEGKPDLKAWGDAVLQHGPKLARFVKWSDKMPVPERSECGRFWSFTKTKDLIAEHAFKKGHENPALASFCFGHGWDDDDFDNALQQIQKYQKQYAANDNKKQQALIPELEIDGEIFGKESYRFYKLPDGDVRGLLLGEFTNCCQHLAGVGEECAKYGFLSEQSGFYVVADKKTDEIIAQSWVWRGQKGELVFDSLESLSGHFNARQWEPLLAHFAKNALSDKKANITAIHVGIGGATPKLSFEKAANKATPIDYEGYRDSEDDQYLVCQGTRHMAQRRKGQKLEPL